MTDDEFIAQLSQHERLLHSISVTFARGDAEEEKDIYQEILYNLWRTRDRYNGQCSIKNWLYRVGRHLYTMNSTASSTSCPKTTRRWCFSTSTAPPRRRWPPFSAFRKPTWVSASTA